MKACKQPNLLAYDANVLLSTLNAIEDGLVILDTDWRYIYLNAQAERLLDFEQRPILGQNFWQLYPEVLGTPLEAAMRSAAEGTIEEVDYFFEPWKRWFQNRCYPNKDGGISVFFIDITKRKEAEETLLLAEKTAREAMERLELALSVSGLGLWEFNCVKLSLQLDSSLTGLLGYSNDDLPLPQSKWVSRIHPDDLSGFHAAIEAHENGETAMLESEYRLRHADGHWVWLQVRGKVTRRDEAGNPLFAMGTMLDISQRKHAVTESAGLLRLIEKMLHDVIGSSSAKANAGVMDSDPLGTLTPRQKDVLRFVALGCTSNDIAKRMNLTPETVKTHRRDLMRRLNLHSVAELTAFAIHHNLRSQQGR